MSLGQRHPATLNPMHLTPVKCGTGIDLLTIQIQAADHEPDPATNNSGHQLVIS